MEKFVTVPFAWLLSFLYDLTGNYGFAMIIFAVLVQLVLFAVYFGATTHFLEKRLNLE